MLTAPPTLRPFVPCSLYSLVLRTAPEWDSWTSGRLRVSTNCKQPRGSLASFPPQRREPEAPEEGEKNMLGTSPTPRFSADRNMKGSFHTHTLWRGGVARTLHPSVFCSPRAHLSPPPPPCLPPPTFLVLGPAETYGVAGTVWMGFHASSFFF